MPRSDRELQPLMPWVPTLERPPEFACALMEAELEALADDIAAVRDRARRVAATGLDLHREPSPSALTGERVALAGGRTVVVRPVESTDAAELARIFGRLGALSRFRRFLARLDRLSERQLDWLVRIDHTHHEALIAFDAQTGAGVAVARCVRDPHDPRAAGFAVVVVDASQGHGLATALLERLAARAEANGIERLVGSTAAGNRAARHLGATTTLDARTGTLQLTITPRTYRARLADPRRRPEPPLARGLPVAVPRGPSPVPVEL